MRSEWSITARRTLPSEEERSTYRPVDQEPPLEWTTARLKFDLRWHDALRSLRIRFVPDRLKRGPPWNTFFGACVMCDPPDECLPEFAKFGAVYPSPFWPVVDYGVEEIDLSKVHSMVAPPTEQVFKESHEEGEPFMEYRIVVDEQTTLADVKNAFHAIKAAYDIESRGGRPPMDKLVAIHCAKLYDDHNSIDPKDRQFKRWTYKKLAVEFKALGVRNERSAEEHVKLGRALLRRAHDKN